MNFPVLELGEWQFNLFVNSDKELERSRTRLGIEYFPGTLFVDADGRVWKCVHAQFIRYLRPWWDQFLPGGEGFRRAEAVLEFQEETIAFPELVSLMEKRIKSDDLQVGSVICPRPLKELVDENLAIMNNRRTPMLKNISAFMRIRRLEKKLKNDPKATEYAPHYFELHQTWAKVKFCKRLHTCPDAKSLIPMIASLFEEFLN